MDRPIELFLVLQVICLFLEASIHDFVCTDHTRFLTYYTYTCPHPLGHKYWNLGTPNHFFHVFNKPVTSRVLRHLETVYRRVTQHDFRSQFFPSYSRQPCLTLPALVNSRWRTETGSSYKLVTGRDINVMSVVTTQSSGMPDPLPPVPTSSNFGEQYQVQTGIRNSTPNRKY